MGGNPNEWPTGMSAKLSELSATLPNFDAYITGGGEHCILNTSNFYTTETAGMNFRDWVAARLAGEATGDVTCDVDRWRMCPMTPPSPCSMMMRSKHESLSVCKSCE